MITVEFAVVAAIVLLVFGACVTIYRNRLSKVSLAFGTAAGLLLGWMIAAASVPKPVVDITYHPITQQNLADGSTVNTIVVKDELGKTHVVNLNDAVSEPIPQDGHAYQVARIRYSGFSFGLKFRELNRYRIIPIENNVK